MWIYFQCYLQKFSIYFVISVQWTFFIRFVIIKRCPINISYPGWDYKGMCYDIFFLSLVPANALSRVSCSWSNTRSASDGLAWLLVIESVSVKDPPDVLDRQKCLDALAALRHAKWFQVWSIFFTTLQPYGSLCYAVLWA